MRGAKNPNKYACPNASGSWSQEIGCWKCKLENGACRHPEFPMQAAEANVTPIGPIPAGPCRAECCDPNLGTLPPDVEDRLLDPGGLGG